MDHDHRPTLSRATLLSLAGKHQVDPRSIAKESRQPGSVRGMAGDRARAALRDARGNGSSPELLVGAEVLVEACSASRVPASLRDALTDYMRARAEHIVGGGDDGEVVATVREFLANRVTVGTVIEAILRQRHAWGLR